MTYASTYNAKIKEIGSARPFTTCKKGRKEGLVAPPDLDKIIHDFRSSLNIILGNSELMLDDAMGRINKQQREGLKDILSSGESLRELVYDIVLWRNASTGDKK